MNPFEALVVSEHDTDKKFIDASSFFVSLKEPVEKTAAKVDYLKFKSRPANMKTKQQKAGCKIQSSSKGKEYC